MEHQKTYVSCFLMGGLGNQLFQIFTTLAYSIKTSRTVVFPYSDVLTTGIARNTYWNSFLSSIKMMTAFNAEHRLSNDDLIRFQLYREPMFSYKDIPTFVNAYPRVTMYGYFQSYKYFHQYKTQIHAMVQLDIQQTNIKREFVELLQQSNEKLPCHNISMHFRLGDYKNNPNYHPIMSYEYYEQALDHIVSMRQRNVKPIRVLYFCESEDNDIVFDNIKQLMKKFDTITFIKVDDGIVDYKQLLLMSCCHDNIIANSSFSWWAAYFNENADKIVCYPSIWFGISNPQNTTDLFPTEWQCC